MEKMHATLTLHDGTPKRIYVYVDDQTAKMLQQLEDREFVNQYLIDEFKMLMGNYSYRRHTVSFEQSQEKGFDLISSIDLLEDSVRDNEIEMIRNAVKKLEPQQQWLCEQIFVERRKQIEIANELGVGESAIRSRLKKIFAKIKNYLN